MIAQEKVEFQACCPQTWDKPTALANIGDRFKVPCTPILQVVDKEILEDGRVWLQVLPVSASYTEEWIVDPEPAQEPQEQPQHTHLEKEEIQQPAGMAGDSVSSQLQPNWDAIADYESGSSHGKLDAANGLEPICSEADCHYSSGYLDGYNSFRQPKPQPETKPPTQWRVTWNTKWCWYEVWQGNAHIGRASNYEEAERIAQKYIASEQLRQQHRDLVLAALAG
jgi:hypothetical protein